MFKSLVVAPCAALFLLLSPVITQAAEPIVIKFAHVVGDDTPKGKGALLFQKLVRERLAGQVEVEVYPNSTLVGDADEMQALLDNKVQMLAPSLSKFIEYSPKLEVLESQFAAVGAKPVVLPFAKVYESLKGGVVQGAENPWSNIFSQNMHSVQPYITESNHGVLDYMLITNNEFWLSMPFAIRSELEGIILEVTQAVNREAAAVNRRDRERILASGSSQLITLTPEERQAWREQMLPVWKTYEAEIGADLIRAAMTVNRRR